MLMISIRKSLEDSDRFASESTYFRLRFSQGDTFETESISLEAMINLLRDKRVLLLIHGYNNNISKVAGAYKTIENGIDKISHDYDEIVGFTWPGGDHALGYYSAKGRSSPAARRLLNIFKIFRFKSLDVMTHSMGARVVLRALCDDPLDSKVVIRNHFSAAAAVEDESIEMNHRFYESTQLTNYNWIFYSKYDGVLRWWYDLADGDSALGLHGPDDLYSLEKHSKNVIAINCRHCVKEHGGYKDAPEFYSFISDVLTGGVAASHRSFTLNNIGSNIA